MNSTNTTNLWAAIKKTPLDSSYWEGLLRVYAAHEMQFHTAYVVKQLSRIKGCTSAELLSMLNIDRIHKLEDIDSIFGRPEFHEAASQIEKLDAWLKVHPGDWLSWLFLARLLDLQGADMSVWSQACLQAQRFEIIVGESVHQWGVWRLMTGNAKGAVELLASLVDLQPVRHGSMIHLGEALLRLGNHRAAELAFTRASHSDNAKLLSLLAEISFRNNLWREAIAVLKKAVSLDPTNVNLCLSLAYMLSQVYHLSECQGVLNHIRHLTPNNREAKLLEIGLLGKYGDARKYFIELNENLDELGCENSRMMSSILMTSLYQDDLTANAVSQLHKHLVTRIESKNASKSSFLNLKRNKKTKLRIGYITGDLHRQHPVSIFMLPLLMQQKKSSLEIFIYHTGDMYDKYTTMAEACTDQWLDASSWDDEALHQRIVADQVDILFDLAGHTSSHRLGVFIKRSAPVQATFLGYPYSTGLNCMDYLVGDHVVSPELSADLFSEKIARLPDSVFCWAPVDDYPLPKKSNRSGEVIFGSFNNPLKLSPATIELWANVLHEVPDSKLLLKAPSFENQEICERFRFLFKNHSIESNRLDFRGPSDLASMMQEYADMDIALDPLPYNGGTTSLQALWMGVPLITLQGESFKNRMGASFLKTLGKHEWIAVDKRDYISKCQILASDVSNVRKGRMKLRKEMIDSSLCNIKKYSKDFECLMHEMWVSNG
jgi:protein O-GlcNAc transferase